MDGVTRQTGAGAAWLAGVSALATSPAGAGLHPLPPVVAMGTAWLAGAVFCGVVGEPLRVIGTTTSGTSQPATEGEQ